MADKISVVVLRPDQSFEVVQAENTLQGMRSLLDRNNAYIQELPVGDGFVCLVDEDGKYNQLHPSPSATALVNNMLAKRGRQLLPGDFIVGTVLFVGAEGEEWADISEEVLEEYFGGNDKGIALTFPQVG